MSKSLRIVAVLVCGVMNALTGCMPARPFYFGDDGDLSHYKAVATEIETPDVDSDRLGDVEHAEDPYSIVNAEAREVWDLTLQEAIQTSLTNSKVVRTLPFFGPGGQAISVGSRGQAPQNVAFSPSAFSSVYDVGIQESDPRFGPEAALSAFDAQLSSSIFWERNDRPQNFFISGFQAPVFQQDLGTQTTELSKRVASGGQFITRNHNNYELNNNPRNLFRGAYTADIETEFRHPLLQGAGTQFNRIAGPNSIPGFYNGVVIARLQVDQALAGVETNVNNQLLNIEQAYWRLSFCYRDLDAKTTGRDTALQWWRIVKERQRSSVPGGEAFIEARAREQYFFFRNQVEDALSELFTAEANLRYLMGLAPTDGRLIRPADEPTTAHVMFDWHEANQEMLYRNVRLRQQKWVVKQAELQLIASKNYLMPRLDTVGRYRWRGLGEKLFDGQREDAINQLPVDANNPNPNTRFNSAYQTLTQGDFTEWQLGLQLSMPIGFRKEMAGVRREELNLCRQRALLQDAELDLSHSLSERMRTLEREFTATRTNFNRVVAVRNEVTSLEAVLGAGADVRNADIFDLLLQAMRRRADAESTFYAAVHRYNAEIAAIHYSKGSLLDYDGVYMAEGPWADKAYFDAHRRAKERDAGMMIDYGFTRPNVSSRGPFDQHPSELPAPSAVPTLAPQIDSPNLDEVPMNEERIPRPMPNQGASASGDSYNMLATHLAASKNTAVDASLLGPELVEAPSRSSLTEIAQPRNKTATTSRSYEEFPTDTTDRADRFVAVGPKSQRAATGGGMRR